MESKDPPPCLNVFIGNCSFALAATLKGMQVHMHFSSREREAELQKILSWLEELLQRDHYQLDLESKQIRLVISSEEAHSPYRYIRFDGISNPKQQELYSSQAIKTLEPYLDSIKAEKNYIINAYTKDTYQFLFCGAIDYVSEICGSFFEQNILPKLFEKSLEQENQKNEALPKWRSKAKGKKKQHFRVTTSTGDYLESYESQIKQLKGLIQDAIIEGLETSQVPETRREDLAMQILYGAEPVILEPSFSTILHSEESGKKPSKVFSFVTYHVLKNQGPVIFQYHNASNVSVAKEMVGYSEGIRYGIKETLQEYWPAYNERETLPLRVQATTSYGIARGEAKRYVKEFFICHYLIDKNNEPYRGSLPGLMATIKNVLTGVTYKISEDTGILENDKGPGVCKLASDLVTEFHKKTPAMLPYHREDLYRLLSRRLGVLLRDEMQGHDASPWAHKCTDNILSRIGEVMNQYMVACANQKPGQSK